VQLLLVVVLFVLFFSMPSFWLFIAVVQSIKSSKNDNSQTKKAVTGDSQTCRTSGSQCCGLCSRCSELVETATQA
jgi:sensor histidine kinase YesM